jgi:hypothetical protein
VLKEGRKTLILVSEGYCPGCGGQMIVPDDLMFDLREVYDTANRQNVAISTVDPRGLAATEFGLDRSVVDHGVDRRALTLTLETLKMLAENTDGRAIVNRNDLTIAMKQIVVDASAYYLLGYSSNVGINDGKFHDIRVRVRRPGVDVRHRRGYWALKPEDAARLAVPIPAASPSPVDAALASTAAPASRPVRTWMGSERGTDGRTRVTFVWEPVRTASRAGGSASPARVMLTAAGTTGAPYFNGPVPKPAVATPASGSRVTFDATPGTMQLRIAVEGSDGSVLEPDDDDPCGGGRGRRARHVLRRGSARESRAGRLWDCVVRYRRGRSGK